MSDSAKRSEEYQQQQQSQPQPQPQSLNNVRTSISVLSGPRPAPFTSAVSSAADFNEFSAQGSRINLMDKDQRTSIEFDNSANEMDSHHFVGPRVRLTRLPLKLLDLAITIWFASGMSFITAIFGCILAATGYELVVLDLTYIGFLAFACYSLLLWDVYRSILRTFLRMCLSALNGHLLSGKGVFNPSKRYSFITMKWISKGYVAVINRFHSESKSKERIHEYYVHATYVFILLLVCTLPLIVASIFGYWTLIGFVLCATVGLSA